MNIPKHKIIKHLALDSNDRRRFLLRTEEYRKKQIPAVKLGERTVRYHPRTVIEFYKPPTRKTPTTNL